MLELNQSNTDEILIKDVNEDTFMDDVIEASKTSPIVVDFWAPWCGPCKTLGPALEAEVKATNGKIKMVKVDIDQNQNLASQMRIQSIPAVFAFVDGQPIDASYAARRSRWEPIYEVTQVKGDGEAHPTLSPDDEFADFENWDQDNIGRTEAKEDWMLKHEYARGALKLGLEYEQSLGVNPFKVGLIASTDGHNSICLLYTSPSPRD